MHAHSLLNVRDLVILAVAVKVAVVVALVGAREHGPEALVFAGYRCIGPELLGLEFGLVVVDGRAVFWDVCSDGISFSRHTIAPLFGSGVGG